MEVVAAQDTDPLVGCKLEYINPTNGQGRAVNDFDIFAIHARKFLIQRLSLHRGYGVQHH